MRRRQKPSGWGLFFRRSVHAACPGSRSWACSSLAAASLARGRFWRGLHPSEVFLSHFVFGLGRNLTAQISACFARLYGERFVGRSEMPSRCALLRIAVGGRLSFKLITPVGVFCFASDRSSFTSALSQGFPER